MFKRFDHKGKPVGHTKKEVQNNIKNEHSASLGSSEHPMKKLKAKGADLYETVEQAGKGGKRLAKKCK